MSGAQHSSESQQWYTPADLIESARFVLGGIDLDPASCEEANRTVRARWYFTKEDDALSRQWGPPRGAVADRPSIFVNPPGGKVSGKSLVSLFWAKLIADRDRFSHAIFLCFSIEAMQTTQRHPLSVCDFPLCVPRSRVKYKPGTEAADSPPNARACSPTHASAIVYVPGAVDRTARFVETFAAHGRVLLPARAA